MTVIKHIGTPRHSGRYPWGSGGNTQEDYFNFLGYVADLKKKGVSEANIAKGLGLGKSGDLRDLKTLVKEDKRRQDTAQAIRLLNKGLSKVAIGERMGIGESSVRSLLDDELIKKNNVTRKTVAMLQDMVAKKKYIDVGLGVEHHIGIARNKLTTAIYHLKQKGYAVFYVPVTQLGTGKTTYVMTLASPGTEWSEVWENKDQIRNVTAYKDPDSIGYVDLEPIKNVSPKRIKVNYVEDGGKDKDGLIELRRGVADISLGNAKYAQVRIGVDETHFLKGMAVYSDDLPKGTDIRFNTNKSKKEFDKMGVMKGQEDDPDNPFGSTVRQKHYIDKDGNKQLSALNIVNEEGKWATWSKNLSSQFLSKQQIPFAKEQLDKVFDRKIEEYKEIQKVTNPIVKEKLLLAFADGVEADTFHLKAAAMPRQASHVLIPYPDMKEDEVYAPGYRDGESVVLVRHPHGGRFEIPRLTVNNKHATAKQQLKDAKDAIGIHPKVAERLSGADFDGDAVIVIPDKNKKVQVSAALTGLKDFDPQTSYKGYEGMKRMTPEQKGAQMGQVSNLITDMTIQGANSSELARAVRHSMVVIDAEKHGLNYKLSAKENDVAGLKTKYQGRHNGGASTVVSKAKSPVYVDKRKIPKIDPKTGKKIYETADDITWVDKNGKTRTQKTKTKLMLETEDAFDLSSGTPMEGVYATHANKLKALTNDARKEAVNIDPTPYSRSARKTYNQEHNALMAKLNLARQNKPLERQAHLIGNAEVEAKLKANPGMDASDLKRVRNKALATSRARVGAGKQLITITDREWEAIQAGAITKTSLKAILDNTDMDRIKQLATPRTTKLMDSRKTSEATALLNRGYTRAQVADRLGVSVSTLNREGI